MKNDISSSTPNTSLSGIISRIARIREKANLFLEQALRARGIAGVVPAHGPVLRFLFQQSEPVAMKELVAATGRVKSTVTGVVNTLEQVGYLKRYPCEEDSRVVRVALTPQGHALRADFEAISEALVARAYGAMPVHERHELNRLLSELEENLT